MKSQNFNKDLVKFLHVAGRAAFKEENEVEYLPGYEALRLQRDHFKTVSEALLRKVHRYRLVYNMLPFVEDVAICNSLAFGTADKDSDVDLFFILDKKRFYFARFCISVIFEIFGLRRKGKMIAGRFCLSFFVAEDKLDFSDILIENDVYFYYWFYYLTFLKGNLNVQTSLLNQNPWFKEGEFSFKNLTICKKGFVAWLIEIVFGLSIFDWLEKWLKKNQIDRIRKKNNELGNPFGVVVKEGFLKFHVKDVRREFRDRYLSL